MLDELQQLLADYAILPLPHSWHPTFLEIAGYPHLENVCSNILQFYLIPTNVHGFGDLLLNTLCSMLPYDWPPPQSVMVHREVVTPTGKRLDLIIETDAFVIGIENKLFHTAINPFDDYHQYLQHLSGGRPFCGVLLSLLPPGNANLHGFHPIRYDDFFQQVVAKLDTRSASVQQPYVTYFDDLVRTVADLKQEQTMESERIAFFRDHRPTVEALFAEINSLRDAMRQTLQKLAGMIDATECVFPLQQGFWRPPAELYDILFYRGNVGATIDIQININLSPAGWLTSLYNTSGDRAVFESWLAERGVAIRRRSLQPYRLAFGTDDLEFDAPLVVVQEQVQRLFRQLSLSPLSRGS